MEKFKEKVEDVQKILEDTMRNYFSDIEANIVNFYRSIRVTNKDWSLNFWIRIYEYNNTLVLDFSSVDIPKEYRRKGIFTKAINELKKCEYIQEIRVTSVLTDAMRNWCIKNDFKKTNEFDFMYNKEVME